MSESYRSGFIALIGRPNVGKSTLLNRLVGRKISIISRRPQTTRHCILGIKTDERAQFIYIDTPGLHEQRKKTINHYMNRAASGSMEGVDCIAFIITAKGWTREDKFVLDVVGRHTCPVILVVNKVDMLADRGLLLPLIEESSKQMGFKEIIPLSAKTGLNLTELEDAILRYLPQQPAPFPVEQVSDRSESFMAAELVREQIFRSFGEELPYVSAVRIERFQHQPQLIRIEAVIWVEKPSQKAIIIGKEGQRLKSIGQRARAEMEKLFGSKVYLGLWVKVRSGWSDDARALDSLGYGQG
ncbi:MAG TPA: GTPase Era [Acidiferrobacterales bacterium]|nr:GTPase Era [Acidiferrobacterales bacterium]